MSQNANILAWLQAGNTITPAQAYEKFGTLALHSRIAELRGHRFPIVCDMIAVSPKKRVGCYRYNGQLVLV